MASKGSICLKGELHKYRIRKSKASLVRIDWCAKMANSPNPIFLWSSFSVLRQPPAFTQSVFFSTLLLFHWTIRSYRSSWESGTLVMPTNYWWKYLFFLLRFIEGEDFWMNQIDKRVLKFKQFFDKWVWRCWHFEANSIWNFINQTKVNLSILDLGL